MNRREFLKSLLCSPLLPGLAVAGAVSVVPDGSVPPHLPRDWTRSVEQVDETRFKREYLNEIHFDEEECEAYNRGTYSYRIYDREYNLVDYGPIDQEGRL